MQEEIDKLRQEIEELRAELKLITGFLLDLEKKLIPTHNQTNRQIIPTNRQIFQAREALKPQISIGNQGVPTDRQTNRQTTHLHKADEILANIDGLKKELRIKFKRLTAQEMAVFSMLYNLEQEGQIVDYPLLSSKLNLSESSIRDYIGKMQNKGIPIIKEKLNNKKITLKISPELKKIASLDTILKLRNL